MECVFKDGVHDPADAKRGLDYVGNNLLHCGQETHMEVKCVLSKIIVFLPFRIQSHREESSGIASH